MNAPSATPPPADGEPGATRMLPTPASMPGRQSDDRNRPPAPSGGVPRRIDKYDVIMALGEGGMGTVYLARDPDLDRKVAIKLVRRELAGNDEYLTRMMREARLCARLHHPNIVSIFQVGTHEDTPYLVLEYVEGKSLHQLLRSAPPLPLATVLDIIAQCCLGLQVAAQKNIVHRDIKPPNIMVSETGEAKIMDFGLSKSVSDTSMTISQAVMGTPDYMAPEQAEGGTVDFRVDVYALGITLFQCCTGYLPYRASSVMTTLLNHQTKPLPEDPHLMQLAGGRLWQLICAMTAKKPSDRPNSYDQIRRELLAIRGMLTANDHTALLQVAEPHSPLRPVASPTPATPDARRRSGSAALPLPDQYTGRRTNWWIPVLLLLAAVAGGAGVYTMLHPGPTATSVSVPPPPPATGAEQAPAVAKPPAATGPLLTQRSRASTATLRDLVVSLQAVGLNILLEKNLNPADYRAAFNFDNAEAEAALRVMCLGANWKLERRQAMWHVATDGRPDAALLRVARRNIDLATLPPVTMSNVGGGVTLMEACEAFRRDAGLNYLIMPRELADRELPRVGLTRTPLPHVLELLQNEGMPFEWTVEDKILLIIPDPRRATPAQP